MSLRLQNIIAPFEIAICFPLTLLHSEQPKLYRVLAVLSIIELKKFLLVKCHGKLNLILMEMGYKICETHKSPFYDVLV